MSSNLQIKATICWYAIAMYSDKLNTGQRRFLRLALDELMHLSGKEECKNPENEEFAEQLNRWLCSDEISQKRLLELMKGRSGEASQQDYKSRHLHIQLSRIYALAQDTELLDEKIAECSQADQGFEHDIYEDSPGLSVFVSRLAERDFMPEPPQRLRGG